MQRLVFGDTSLEKSTQTCAFQCMAIGRDHCVRSVQCHRPPLANGWCSEHQHAQAGMDLGEQLGYPRVEVPMCRMNGGDEMFILAIGRGRENWLAYFERALNPGLKTVMKYLENMLKIEYHSTGNH